MTWFDQDGRPAAVDMTHPVDLLEPEDEPQERGTPPLITVVEAVARTFFTGDSKITLIAWRVLLGDEWESIRACARRSGCTAAAISKRVAILSRQFKQETPKSHQRRLARLEQRERFQSLLKRERREDRNPPAASDDRSKTDTPATPDKEPSVNADGVNDLSGFSLNAQS
jgi:hypothetical protein